MSIDIKNVDCIHGMRDFVKSESVDMVLTSPPYDSLPDILPRLKTVGFSFY